MEDYRSKLQHILSNAVLLTDAALRMKERVTASEKHHARLRSLVEQGQKVTHGVDSSAQAHLLRAELLVRATSAALKMVPGTEEKQFECERFLRVIRKESVRYGQGGYLGVITTSLQMCCLISMIIEHGVIFQGHAKKGCHTVQHIDLVLPDHAVAYHMNLTERISKLKEKQRELTASAQRKRTRRRHSCPAKCSTISTETSRDEIYPESYCSRESLLVWSSLADLPSVPEELLDRLGSHPGRRDRSPPSTSTCSRLWTNAVIREEDEGSDESGSRNMRSPVRHDALS